MRERPDWRPVDLELLREPPRDKLHAAPVGRVQLVPPLILPVAEAEAQRRVDGAVTELAIRPAHTKHVLPEHPRESFDRFRDRAEPRRLVARPLAARVHVEPAAQPPHRVGPDREGVARAVPVQPRLGVANDVTQLSDDACHRIDMRLKPRECLRRRWLFRVDVEKGTAAAELGGGFAANGALGTSDDRVHGDSRPGGDGEQDIGETVRRARGPQRDLLRDVGRTEVFERGQRCDGRRAMRDVPSLAHDKVLDLPVKPQPMLQAREAGRTARVDERPDPERRPDELAWQPR